MSPPPSRSPRPQGRQVIPRRQGACEEVQLHPAASGPSCVSWARGIVTAPVPATECVGVPEEAKAFWVATPGRGEIRDELLPTPSEGDVVVRALYSGIS